MSTKTKIVLALVAVAVVGGAYFFPASTIKNYTTSVTAPSGTTSSNQKLYTISWSLLTSTSTALYNSDADDRAIISFVSDCSGVGLSYTPYTGAGLSTLKFQAATTSTSAPGSVLNTNYTINSSISTSTVDMYLASTTPGLTGASAFRVWPTGTYMTIFSNATNTASCIVGFQTMAL